MKKVVISNNFDILIGSDGGDRTPDLPGMNRSL